MFAKPDLILLDIEGFESVALTKGSAETIKSDTIWLIEIHGDSTLEKYGGSNRKCVELFDEALFDRHFAKLDDIEIAFKPSNHLGIINIAGSIIFPG